MTQDENLEICHHPTQPVSTRCISIEDGSNNNNNNSNEQQTAIIVQQSLNNQTTIDDVDLIKTNINMTIETINRRTDSNNSICRHEDRGEQDDSENPNEQINNQTINEMSNTFVENIASPNIVILNLENLNNQRTSDHIPTQLGCVNIPILSTSPSPPPPPSQILATSELVNETDDVAAVANVVAVDNVSLPKTSDELNLKNLSIDLKTSKSIDAAATHNLGQVNKSINYSNENLENSIKEFEKVENLKINNFDKNTINELNYVEKFENMTVTKIQNRIDNEEEEISNDQHQKCESFEIIENKFSSDGDNNETASSPSVKCIESVQQSSTTVGHSDLNVDEQLKINNDKTILSELNENSKNVVVIDENRLALNQGDEKSSIQNSDIDDSVIDIKSTKTNVCENNENNSIVVPDNKNKIKEDPIVRLNKLRANISNALREVKGVLRKYSSDLSQDNNQLDNSQMAPVADDSAAVQFRFVRKIRRRSQLSEDQQDDIQQVQNSVDALKLNAIDENKTVVKNVNETIKKSETSVGNKLNDKKEKSPQPTVTNKVVSDNSAVSVENLKKEPVKEQQQIVSGTVDKKIISTVKKTVNDEKSGKSVNEPVENELTKKKIISKTATKTDNGSEPIKTVKKILKKQANVDEAETPITNNVNDVPKNSKLPNTQPEKSIKISTKLIKENVKVQPNDKKSTGVIPAEAASTSATNKRVTRKIPLAQPAQKSSIEIKSTPSASSTLAAASTSKVIKAIPKQATVKLVKTDKSTSSVLSEVEKLLQTPITKAAEIAEKKIVAAVKQKIPQNVEVAKKATIVSIPLSQRAQVSSNQLQKDTTTQSNETPEDQKLNVQIVKTDSQETDEEVPLSPHVPKDDLARKRALEKQDDVKSTTEEEGTEPTLDTEEKSEEIADDEEAAAAKEPPKKRKAKKKVVIRRIKRKLSIVEGFIETPNAAAAEEPAEICEKEIYKDDEEEIEADDTPAEKPKPKSCLKVREYEPGDLVMYADRFKKTQVKWRLATVVERITSISYKLNIEGEEKTCHLSYIKKHTGKKLTFGGKEYLEIDYAQIEADEEEERNFSIWNLS